MRSTTRETYEERIRRAVRAVIDHLDDPKDGAELADLACFSRFHFHRIFKGLVGESVDELRRRLLMERAAYQLRTAAASVFDVATNAGFVSPEAFARAFRKAYGMPPRDYRSALSVQDMRLASPNSIHYGATPDHLALPLAQGEPMQVQTLQAPAMRLAAIRHIGPYDEIGPVFGRLWQWVGEARVPAGDPIAIYHDNPQITPAGELRSDAAVIVPADFSTDSPEITILDIPANTYAVYRYEGPYEGLGQAWTRFVGEWLPQSGYELGKGICFERYRNDPINTPPESLVTELYEPIALA